MNIHQNGKAQAELYRIRWLTICVFTRKTTTFVFNCHLVSMIPVNMATLSSKPGLRYSVSDWATNNKQISHTAENKRNVSHEIRQEGRALRNETTSKVMTGVV